MGRVIKSLSTWEGLHQHQRLINACQVIGDLRNELQKLEATGPMTWYELLPWNFERTRQTRTSPNASPYPQRKRPGGISIFFDSTISSKMLSKCHVCTPFVSFCNIFPHRLGMKSSWFFGSAGRWQGEPVQAKVGDGAGWRNLFFTVPTFEGKFVEWQVNL